MKASRAPYFYPLKPAGTVTESLLKGLDEDSAILKTRQGWERDQPGAEGHDRYWARLFQLPDAFHERFINDAPSIWQPIIEATVDE